MMSFSTASATSQMNKSPLECRAGRRCSSGLGRSLAMSGILRGFKYPVKEIRGFRYQFGVLDTRQEIRGFTYRNSGYQILRFGVLHTGLRGFKYLGFRICELAEGLRRGHPHRNT